MSLRSHSMDADAHGDQQDENSQGEEAVDVAHVFFCGARAVRARKPCGKSELKVFDRSMVLSPASPRNRNPK